MRKIPLHGMNGKGRFAIVDNDDYERLNKYRWHAAPHHLTAYVRSRPKRRVTIFMHRLIMDAKIGQSIDHINGNGLDNRKHNLRFCTARENCWNQHGKRKSTTSRFIGVHWATRERRWMAQIAQDGKSRYVGSFHTEIAARLAYLRAKKIRDNQVIKVREA